MRATFIGMIFVAAMVVGVFAFPPACLGAFKTAKHILMTPIGGFGYEQFVGRRAVVLHIGPVGAVPLHIAVRWVFALTAAGTAYYFLSSRDKADEAGETE